MEFMLKKKEMINFGFFRYRNKSYFLLSRIMIQELFLHKAKTFLRPKLKCKIQMKKINKAFKIMKLISKIHYNQLHKMIFLINLMKF